MIKVALTLLVILAILNAATCQTFQYSRGWTNGKRNKAPVSINIPQVKITDLPISGLDLHASQVVSAPCCNGNCSIKWGIMSLRIDGNAQFYLVPCELVRAHYRSVNREEQQDISPADGHHRRSLSAEYNSNNDNY